MNITDKIKQAVYESTQQIIKPVYNKIKETFSTKEETNDIKNTVGELELRTHIGKQLDYGSFSMTSNSNTEFIYFNKKNSGNLEVDSDGNIILKPNRKYNIAFAVRTDGSLILQYKLYDKSSNSEIGNSNITTQADQTGVNPAIDIIETGNEKIKLCLKRIYNYGSGHIYSSNSFLIIQEINRQVILDPAEDAKNLEFDYGYFENYENYQFKTGVDFPFKVKKSNLELSDNGYPILKKNKSYSITISLQLYSSGRYTCRFYDNLTSSILSDNYIDIESSSASATQSIIIKPESDIEFCLNGLANKSGYLRYSSLIIEEIAHPYYFNYFKDSLSSKVLFEGEASAIGEYELLDDITNYEWLVVYGCTLYSGEEYACINSLKIKVSDIVFKDNDSSSKQNFPLFIPYTGDLNNAIINLDFNNQNHFNIISNKNITTYNKIIYKIEGIGFNYDNPYKDLISSGDNVDIDEFEFTDEEIENNLAGIWGDE